jgi:hypothetical protein
LDKNQNKVTGGENEEELNDLKLKFDEALWALDPELA